MKLKLFEEYNTGMTIRELKDILIDLIDDGLYVSIVSHKLWSNNKINLGELTNDFLLKKDLPNDFIISISNISEEDFYTKRELPESDLKRSKIIEIINLINGYFPINFMHIYWTYNDHLYGPKIFDMPEAIKYLSQPGIGTSEKDSDMFSSITIYIQ